MADNSLYENLKERAVAALRDGDTIRGVVTTWIEETYGHQYVVKHVEDEDNAEVAQVVLDAIWPGIEPWFSSEQAWKHYIQLHHILDEVTDDEVVWKTMERKYTKRELVADPIAAAQYLEDIVRVSRDFLRRHANAND